MEASERALAPREVHGSFGADRGIDLRDERRRYPHATDAAPQKRRRHRDEVAADAAADGDEDAMTVESGGERGVAEALDRGEPLGPFARDARDPAQTRPGALRERVEGGG